ncbi:MAG: hypothetical protein JWM64_245 [Frankiales bacterium]|nr:hypothetical protein [Frankiales bacterium]
MSAPPGTRRGPAPATGTGPTSRDAAAAKQQVRPESLTDVRQARRYDPQDATGRWARGVPGGLDGLPLYGSAEFEAAPQPTKVASAVCAAEAWRRECDPHVIAERLALEVEAAHQAEERNYVGWRTVALGVRARAGGTSHDELTRLRGTPGYVAGLKVERDHPGGPVPRW